MKVRKKTLRDRVIWIAARIMTPLFHGFDSEQGDSLSISIECRKFLTEEQMQKRAHQLTGQIATLPACGELVTRYTYSWNPEENADSMSYEVITKELNSDAMELEEVHRTCVDVDMDTFVGEKLASGGWANGRKSPGGRPPVREQRLAEHAEPVLIPGTYGKKGVKRWPWQK